MTHLLPDSGSSLDGTTAAKDRGRKIVWGVLIGGAIAAVAGVAYFYYRRRGFSFGRASIVSTPVNEGGMTLTHYRDKRMPINERLRILQDLAWKSVQDPRNRKLALGMTNTCPERDGECEARAIYGAIKDHVRYTGDIAPLKLGADGPIEGIDLFQAAHRTWEFRGGDCLPAGTLLLVEGHRLVPVEDVLPGSRIWGLDRWSQVENVWYKGTLPIDAVRLNNGSWIKATPDHKVYVAFCKSHPVTYKDNSKSCSCPMSEREVKRINVSALCPRMVLVTPDRLPFGTDELDPDRTYVEGLYLSDGWCSHPFDFDIAGRDGHPKEAQKRRVKEICDRLGVNTTWFEKSIRIRNSEWAKRTQLMGHRAPEKRALSIDLDEGAAGALLRGIMADSGVNTNGNGRTFTTTSRALALQTRLLWKMFGVTCGERYIESHGGLGQNPIWRLNTRDQNRSDGKREKLLRVKTIERGVDTVPVWDIATDDHYVYLPEADVTVSNCDDHSVLAATMLTLNGIPAKFRVTSATRSNDWSHIYVVAGLPKMRPTRWIPIDTTLPGKNKFGYEVPYGKKADYAA